MTHRFFSWILGLKQFYLEQIGADNVNYAPILIEIG